jgi:hypothetical protein
MDDKANKRGGETMSRTWLAKEELMPLISNKLEKADV